MSPVPVNISRYERLTRRLLGIVGGSAMTELEAKLGAYIGLELDRPEWAFLSAEQLEGFVLTAAAVVAESSYVGIRNPIGSNRLITVTFTRVHRTITSSDSLLGVGPNTGLLDPAGALVLSPRDTRWMDPSTQRSGVESITGAQAVVLPAGWWGLDQDTGGAVAGGIYDYTEPFVLHPGFAAAWFNLTVNEVMMATWAFKSRPLEEDEVAQ